MHLKTFEACVHPLLHASSKYQNLILETAKAYACSQLYACEQYHKLLIEQNEVDELFFQVKFLLAVAVAIIPTIT